SRCASSRGCGRRGVYNTRARSALSRRLTYTVVGIRERRKIIIIPTRLLEEALHRCIIFCVLLQHGYFPGRELSPAEPVGRRHTSCVFPP
ncbi:unnamed protein product, partial [Ectocarpus sp. 13 AM-2016]